MPRQNQTKSYKTTNINPKSLANANTLIVKNKTSLFSSIKEGFGFSIGSSIARNLFGGSNEPSKVYPNEPSKVKPTSACVEYKKCLESDDKYECFSNLNQNEYNDCKLIH
jgi:hypothetical protein